MRNPLNKRFTKELKKDAGKYIALFLFLTLTIGFVSGFLLAGSSMKETYNRSFDRYNVEDGHFALAQKASKDLIEDIEDQDVNVYPLFYRDISFKKDKDIRIFKIRKDVNKACLMKGRQPKKDKEIAIDRMFAEKNDIEVGDDLTLSGKKFKIVGFVALSDYSAMFKNNGDLMFDADNFTIATVTAKTFDSIKDGDLVYNYAWRCKDQSLTDKQKNEIAQDVQDQIAETRMVTDYLKRWDNQAITFTGNDLGSDRIFMIILMVLLMIVIAFIFAVLAHATVERESQAIGTLLASGYTKWELIRHYMTLPILVMLVSGLVGNILGYTFMKDLSVAMYYGSYSLTKYDTFWDAQAFILTTVIPTALVVLMLFIVLAKDFRHRALEFLRDEIQNKEVKGAIRLPKLRFFARFRIRIFNQNKGSYFVLFMGVVVASVMLLFGSMLSPMLENFKEDIVNSQISEYQYIMKAPLDVKRTNPDAENFKLIKLNYDGREDIMVYGIEEDSNYISKKIPKGKVLATEGVFEKFKLDEGDKFSMKQEYSGHKFKFKLAGTYHYPAVLSVFMNMDDFDKKFEYDQFASGYFSDERLKDVDQEAIASVIDNEQYLKIWEQFDDMLGKLFLVMGLFSSILYMLIIYLLSKQIIERNARIISLIKVLGYNNKEVSRLFNRTTGLAMLFCLILAQPITTLTTYPIGDVLMEKMKGWMPMHIAPWTYAFSIGLGMASYFVVYLLQRRKMAKIPMSVAVKEVE